MVRSSSTASCFKLITCGGDDSVDRDDLGAPESKDSSDRSRWSFRKRSARHRVLSNSVTSETLSMNKASQNSATVSFQTQPSSTLPEKNPVVQWTEEKNQVHIPVDSKLSESIAATEDKNRTESTPDEAVAIIIIQSAIRRFLAQRVLLKHKNIIKLQAAVRGHIVRRHAVGSLRCVQAIVKMQALVRERCARSLLKGSSVEERLDEKNGNHNHDSLMEKENGGTKSYATYTSIEKLLSNGFARQLLESTPKTKTINIKCDPSKSDSAWKWLERWMSVLSMANAQSKVLGSAAEQQYTGKNEESDCPLETVISSPENCQSRDVKSNIESFPAPPKADENVITYEADGYDFQECMPTLSSVSRNLEQSQPRSIGESNSSSSTLDSIPCNSKESDLVSKIEPDSVQDNSKMEGQNVNDLETPGSEGSEIDGKITSFGSRKSCNPAFIAAQSKFEELSSVANLGKSVSLSNQDGVLDSSSDAVLPVVNEAFATREIGPAESLFSQTSGVQVGGSECGTELSISSTLDSPDRFEVGAVDFEKETKNDEKVLSHISKNNLNLEVDEKVESILLENELSYSNSSQLEIHEGSAAAECEHVSYIMSVDSSQAEQKPDTTATVTHMELESETSHPMYKSSPEASPRSHVIPESQGTPSSQASVKPKKMRSGKLGSNNKRGAVSTVKESHSESNHDHGARSNSEHLSKAGKRRNSFGSAKSDHGDQEPRDSSSSNSLPSYMQATESARAKALANSSPRSSPDVQDKDLHIKKRQSLPGANTRQVSPRVMRSMSQAQQGAKGNETHSPQERKWRR